MKKFIYNLFLCLLLSSVSDAASPSDNDSHFCVPVDLEKLEQYRQSRPAAGKQALSHTRGPSIVRMIYFVSDPQKFKQEVVDKMKTTIREVQRIFADQIRAHGFGERTFNYETGCTRVNPWFMSYMVPEVITTMCVRLNVFNGNMISSQIFTSSSWAMKKTFNYRNVLGLGLQTYKK